MKLTYRQLQTIYSGLRRLHGDRDVTLKPGVMAAIAININTLRPYLESYEQWSNKVLVELRDKAAGAPDDGTLSARHELATREEGNKTVEIELKLIKAQDLDLLKNAKIPSSALGDLGPVIEGLEDIV